MPARARPALRPAYPLLLAVLTLAGAMAAGGRASANGAHGVLRPELPTRFERFVVSRTR